MLVERLLTNCCSPLYGNRAEPLREELHGIGPLLSGWPVAQLAGYESGSPALDRVERSPGLDGLALRDGGRRLRKVVGCRHSAGRRSPNRFDWRSNRRDLNDYLARVTEQDRPLHAA